MNNTDLLKSTKNNAPATQGKDLKTLLASPMIIKRLEEIIGKNTGSFCASLIQICNNNDMLKKAEPNTVISAAIVAATLNLPINNALGFAYIIPFHNTKAKITEAQFQIGYKGLIQLAMRSGQIKRLVTTEIYANQIISRNPIKGYEFDFDKLPEVREPAAGYYAYMELVNGFVAEAYMTVEEVKQHAARYSQTFRKGYGIWFEHFDEMAKKTVMKQLLSKYAPMSIELQRATLADQSVSRTIPENENVIDVAYQYPDNDDEVDAPSPEKDRVSDSEFEVILNNISTGNISIESALAQYEFNDEQLDQINKL